MNATVEETAANSCAENHNESHEEHPARTALILDVSPGAYAEIRDQLRRQGRGGNVGNKLIHLDDIPLREQEPNREGLSVFVFGVVFAAFLAVLIWAVTHMWAS